MGVGFGLLHFSILDFSAVWLHDFLRNIFNKTNSSASFGQARHPSPRLWSELREGQELVRSPTVSLELHSRLKPGVQSERDSPFLSGDFGAKVRQRKACPLSHSLSCLKSLLGCHNFGNTVQTLQGGPEAFVKEALLVTCIRTGTSPQHPSLQPHYTTLRFPKQTALVPP